MGLANGDLDEDDAYQRLRNRCEVNQLRIDDELAQHPILLMEVNERTAEAVAARDAAQAALSTTKAEAESRLRHSAADGKPLSEARISSEMPLDPEVIAAQRQLDDMKFRAARWLAMADAMRAKGHAMKTLADLMVAGFVAPNSAIRRRHDTERRRGPLQA